MRAAAARNATTGSPVEETGAAPFTDGPWLFSYNGAVEGFRGGLGTELRRSLSARRDAGILGSSDSEVLFALLLDRLDAGTPAAEAVQDVVDLLRTRAGGRFNLLLADGHTIVASRCGNELFSRTDPQGASWVVSEPTDDEPGWCEVPDGTLVVATRDHIDWFPL